MADPNQRDVAWVYDNQFGKPNSEDYLLGKAVDDKTLETAGTEGRINAVEFDCAPESIFSSRAEHQVDLQRKLQEDPLVSLKLQEVDTRKRVLDNPLKMKQIGEYIKKMKDKKKRKDKKDKKKRKRYRKDLLDGDELDTLLLQKLGATGPSTSSSSSAHGHPRDRGLHRRRGSPVDDPRPSGGRPGKEGRPKSPRTRSRSPHPDRQRRHQRSRSRDNPEDRQGRRRRDLGSSGGGGRNDVEEEKQRRLREMMDNAKWRDEQRSANVRRYQAEEELEEARARPDGRGAASFIRNELSKAAAASTVERRVQSNKYNIQRTSASMDENFARR